LYRVYKSHKVNVGTPKPLVNKIESINLDVVNVSDDKNVEDMENVDANKEYDRIIKEAHEMYSKIIEEANDEAKRIADEKLVEIENLKQNEMQKAYEQGFKQGLEDARRKTSDIIKEAADIVIYLNKRKEAIFKEAEEEIVELVLNLVKKIIGDEIQQNKDTIISQIKIALEKCTYRNKVTIRVSSEDYPNVLVNKDIIESLVEGISELEIIEDKFLKKGDCIVDTPSGEVNSSIELQIEQLQKAFYFALRNE